MKLGRLLLAFFIPLTGLAQTPSDTRTLYTTADGLSNNTISSIVKDTRGFLWLGTGEGLNRFDGAHFMPFFSDPGNPATLSGNNIYDVIQYQPGRLLIATNNGLSVLNTLTNSFENEKITTPALQRGSGIYVKSLFKDHEGRIFVNYEGEIDVLSNDLKFLYRLTDTEWGRPLKGIIVNFEQWLQDSEGRIWIPSGNFGICILDEKARQLYSFKNNPLHYTFIQAGGLRSFYYDELNKKVFLSYVGDGLLKYDMVTGQVDVQYFGLTRREEARTINAITRKGDKLICGGSQHIYSVNPVTLQYETLYQQSGTQGSFLDCAVILNDTDNIWIGTETKGLVQMSYSNSYVQHLPLPYPIPDYPVTCGGIHRAANGFLYFAYGHQGLVEADEEKKLTRQYPLKNEQGQPVSVVRIIQDNDDQLLLGTTSGCWIFHTHTKKISRTSWLPAFTNLLNINCLLRDRSNNTWMSFKWSGGLGYYESKTGVFHYYPKYLSDRQSLFDTSYIISRMMEDKLGNIWMIPAQATGTVQTTGTILQWQAATHTWKTYPEKGAAAIRLLSGKVLNGIYVADSSIWLGNIYGLGLVRYDYLHDSIQQFGRKDGLLSDNVLAISKGRGNNLFICTMAGIDDMNMVTHEARALITDNSTYNWGYAFIQYYDSIHNELIYGLGDRIVIANSRLLEATTGDSLVTYLDDIRIDNSLYRSDGSPIRLDHGKKNISISFTSVNYNRNATVVYAYRMQGVDKDWNISRQSTAANYSNLAPGEYVFMVKARDQSGTWGPVNDSLHIVILPAIWQMIWFWLLIGLVAAFVLIVLVRRRISHIKKAAGLKQKLAETEMMALRSQMNPHFIFNCLNAIDNLVQTHQTDKATAYLSSFARLIRSLLENTRNNLVPLYKDMDTLRLYLHLEQFRTSNKFSYELVVDEELTNGDYKVPPLIVQPFVENAIQHGLLNKEEGERKLSIHARLREGFIQYIIRDNGVGRVVAGEIKAMNKPEHRSYGIQITTERVQLHNRHGKQDDVIVTDLFIDDKPAGTQVQVRINTD